MELVMKLNLGFQNESPLLLPSNHLMGNKCSCHRIYYVVYSKCFTKVNFNHLFFHTFIKMKNK